jgi:hypothetical protein
MIVYNPEKDELKIEIPLTTIDDVILYQNALLRILGRINIESNDTQLKEDLKIIYLLLSHTKTNQDAQVKIINSEK